MSVLSGSVVECWAHECAEHACKLPEFFALVAQFTDVEERTVARWATEGLPVGEYLLRLQYYLEMRDFDLDVLRKLSKYVRDTGRIIASRVVTLRDAATLLGYSEGKSGTDTLLKILRGEHGLTKARQEKFSEFIAAYGPEFESRKNAVVGTPPEADSAEVGVSVPAEISTPPLVSALPLRVREKQEKNGHELTLSTLAGLVKVMIPLAEMVASDSFTAAERARFRELTGGDGMFKFSNTFFALCGERSRKAHR